MEEQVLKNKQDIAYHYEIDRTLANFGIKVIGVIANVSELPVPYTGDYGDAYAVGQPGDYTYYIWTRANPDLGYTVPFWLDAGKLAVDAELGTIVTVDGQKQTTWNADTKLDKVVVSGGKGIYAFLANGTQGTCSVSTNNYTCYPNTGINASGAVAGYVTTNWGAEKPNGDGILLSNDPTQPYHVATKNYVDTTTANKSTTNQIGNAAPFIFNIAANGNIGKYYVAGVGGNGFYSYTYPTYWPADLNPSNTSGIDTSVLWTGNPKKDYHCATKKYVDAATALYKTTIEIEDGLTGESYTLYMNTHKDMEGSTGMELQELCQFLSESGEDDDYSGMNAFLFEHIAISGQGLYFIAAIQDKIEDDGTVVFGIRVGNQSSFLAINGSALCVVRQSKA